MSDFTNYLRANKKIEKSIRKSEEKKAIKRLEEKIIYSKTSEEYKAIKWLENKTTNYSDNSLVLHYNNILYYLIMNLMKKNQQLQEKYNIRSKAYNEVLLENASLKDKADLYKEVIEEVREEVENSSLEVNTREYGTLTVCNSDNLLQILDKVKENKWEK